MRILILSDFDNQEGGAEVYRSFLKQGLEEKGHDVRIFSKPKERPFYKKFFSLKDYRDLENKIEDFEPDAVFAHALGNNISPFLLKVPQNQDISCAVKLSDIGTYRREGLFTGKFLFVRFFWSRILRWAISRNTDFYLAQSSYVADWIKENFNVEDQNLHLIRNPPLYDETASLEKNNSKKILFVGRMSEEKGTHVLINSFNQLEDQNAQLELIGPGNTSHFEEKINEEVRDRVEFKGRIDHKNLKQRYRNARIFVLPSTIEETFGLTILESMTQGTPVITTDIGGQKELLEDGENGFLIEPDDSDELRDKIEYALKSQDKIEEMSKSALGTAKKYSLKNHIEKMEKFFQEVKEKSR